RAHRLREGALPPGSDRLPLPRAAGNHLAARPGAPKGAPVSLLRTEKQPMAKHLTVSGHTIEYEANAPTARFLARVQALLDDPRSTEDEMIALVYGPDNPILDKTIFPGRGAVTPAVLAPPVSRVLTAHLARKRVQSSVTPV